MVRDVHQRLIPQTLQAQSIFVEDLTGGSELDGFARAVEKAVALFLLQLADLRADRRLGTEDFLSRAREAALPCHLEESNKLIEVHE